MKLKTVGGTHFLQFLEQTIYIKYSPKWMKSDANKNLRMARYSNLRTGSEMMLLKWANTRMKRSIGRQSFTWWLDPPSCCNLPRTCYPPNTNNTIRTCYTPNNAHNLSVIYSKACPHGHMFIIWVIWENSCYLKSQVVICVFFFFEHMHCVYHSLSVAHIFR